LSSSTSEASPQTGDSPFKTSLVERLRQAAPTISVGVLTADLLALGAELASIERAGVQVLHVDVMDGCFTPMMTVGPPFIRALRTPLLKDVHLMIEEPLGKLAEFAAAGADIITVHVESCTHIHRVLQHLGGLPNANDPTRGIVRGVALNPGTPLEVLEPLVSEVDLVVLLAINPGWGGQAFLPSTVGRAAGVREIAARAGRPILLGIDGGVTRQNVAMVASIGADLVVTGSAVFDGRNAPANAEFMIAEIRRAGAPSGRL
jgi:ribulose-phosphate 3-epimerase